MVTKKDLTKEQRRALLNAKEHHEYVVDPRVLDPLISAYDQSLETLKNENLVLRNDVTKLADGMQILIDDNKKLRQEIKKKNLDLSNTLQTIGLEEGELITSLKDQVKLLEEENISLTFKVNQLKEILENERNQNIGGDDEILECKLNFLLIFSKKYN